MRIFLDSMNSFFNLIDRIIDNFSLLEFMNNHPYYTSFGYGILIGSCVTIFGIVITWNFLERKKDVSRRNYSKEFYDS